MSEIVLNYLKYEFYFFALQAFLFDMDFPVFASSLTLEPALLFLSLIYTIHAAIIDVLPHIDQ